MILTGENGSTGRKTCHSATLSTTNPILSCVEGPSNNSLSHGRALTRLHAHLLCNVALLAHIGAVVSPCVDKF